MKKRNNKTLKKLKDCRKILFVLAIVSFSISLITPVYAASDPLTVINNLSNFMFGMIRGRGMIITGYSIVQIGLSFMTHDPSQRANGFLFVAGGLLITFAKEILGIITG